ncbi:MAG: Swt1 family HEPN domain-containing protein, partial [Hyphomicrobium sp.]
LIPFVEMRLESSIKGHWQVEVVQRVQGLKPNTDGGMSWDQQGLLKTMMAFWKEAFGTVLGHPERSYVSELLDVRNKLSHNENFTYDDAERALDSMRRLMESISAGETADQLGKMRDTILRTKFTELQRNEERRKTQRLEISVETVAGLLPWREVVEPHQDVATGEFQQAEFAADLGKVYNGSAPAEYRDPQQFFSRTYLTEGLSTLLIGAAKRLSSGGGDPVVELQTNFGGGKTHSMLALYHMAGGTRAQDLSGLDQLLEKHGLTVPAKINRAVLVGTSRGPQDVLNAAGERKIRTTWGELAWQLGGEEAFDMIAQNDANGIAPGSNLLEAIFRKCSPCLILIDEWVAYLRQIYRVEGLPSGSFDANLSFVQSLTEAVKASPGTLLVASLPASQIEVGGEGGQEALARL